MVEKTVVQQRSSTLEFSSNGTVQTADGRTIDFSMGLSVARSENLVVSNRATMLLDPIVLSFDDGFNTLSDSTFSFDINGDGNEEEISSLSSGSGFLALDKNGDGVINDGTELFGPETGHGYDELMAYDVDGNMWIDENDPIFSELKVWMGAGTEDAKLVSLKEAGVGALFLGSTDTNFEMRNSAGELLGNIERTGLFLMEDGEPRSMQEVDFNIGLGENSVEAGSTATGEELESGNGWSDPVKLALRQAIETLKILLEKRSEDTVNNGYFTLLATREERLEEKFWSWQQVV